MKDMNQETFEKELAPLLLELLEKARKNNVACLFAVQVEGVVRISGNLLDTSPRLTNALAFLLDESEPLSDLG